jgi:hypothetical protein
MPRIADFETRESVLTEHRKAFGVPAGRSLQVEAGATRSFGVGRRQGLRTAPSALVDEHAVLGDVDQLKVVNAEEMSQP